MDKNNIVQLPQHIIDIERASQDVPFGNVGPFYIRRHEGRTVGLTAETNNELRFQNSDEALLYIADKVKSFPADKNGEVKLTISFTNGVVKKITNTSAVTTKY